MSAKEMKEKTEEVNDKNEQSKNELNETAGEQQEGAKTSQPYSMNLAIIGGVVGAGIGLLASPEASRNAMKHLRESEFVKTASQEFRETAQQLLSKQAQAGIRQLTDSYISKLDEGLLTPKKVNGETVEPPYLVDESQASKYEEIKEENKNLNERLERIEQMLSDLASNKDQS